MIGPIAFSYLRLDHGGSLGPEGIVESNGVAEHAAGGPAAAVPLPLAHRQVCETTDKSWNYTKEEKKSS